MLIGEMPDLTKALYKFIRFASVDTEGPIKDTKTLIIALQNRVTLPPKTCWISYLIKDIKRRGSNITEYDTTNEQSIIQTHWIAEVEISFWDDDEKYLLRAISLNTLANSFEGANFFKRQELCIVGCSDPQIIGYVNEMDQYGKRILVTLSIEFTTKVRISTKGSSGPLGTFLENVDVHHPPR
jgi:hypothetical protein